LPSQFGSWHDLLVDWAQAVTIISALAVFTGLQAFWIARALDRVHAELDRIHTAIEGLDARVRDLGERVAHLEAVRSG
jgi:hypothetical protein